MSPEQVLTICLKRWPNKKRGKRANMNDEFLGADVSWADMIRVGEGVAISVLSNVLGGQAWRKREVIAMRRIVDTILRNASEPADFYAMPLYVSAGFLQAIETATSKKWASFRTEHVLPLAVYASCTNIAADPLRYVPTVRKALIGPICKVTVEEDKKLKRKETPDPSMPFMRYEGKIDVYNTVDGEWVDPEAWTFDDHVALMKKVPAYSSGALLYESQDNPWRDILEKIQGRSGWSV